jgi:hypothetical protein
VSEIVRIDDLKDYLARNGLVVVGGGWKSRRDHRGRWEPAEPRPFLVVAVAKPSDPDEAKGESDGEERG